MRVLSYNIHGWRTIEGKPNYDLLLRLLTAIEADVIGLNEVYHPEPTEAGPALNWLAEQLGMQVVFAAKRSYEGGDRPFGASGNALLTRFPLVSTYSGLYTPIAGKKQRGWLETQLDLGNRRTLSILVTHLAHEDETTRQNQFAEQINWFNQSGQRPDLILGDFNCLNPKDFTHLSDLDAVLNQLPEVAQHLSNSPNGPQLTHQVEQAGYIDTGAWQGLRDRGTFVGAEIPVRLDYIWVRSDSAVRLVKAAIVEEEIGQEASDHRPVMADFKLQTLDE